MRSCGCSCGCRFPYFSVVGGGVRSVSPFCLFFSVSYWSGTMFLPLVFSGLLVGSLRAVVGRVGLLSLFVVYPPPCRGGLSHTTDMYVFNGS